MRQILMGIGSGWNEVLAHKLRSFLTLFGIMLGAAALVGMLGVVKGLLRGMETMIYETGGIERISVMSRPAPEAQREMAALSPGRTLNDVDAILAACTARTKLVFIANPANPTGTMIGAADMARLADGIPESAILVLDGAYAEFAEGYDGGVALVESRQNVVMTRTFSKIYGLGGLRVGWAYGPREVIDNLNRIRGPFNLSNVAQDMAEAAVRDQDYIATCRADNARNRAWLAAALAEIGVPSDPSSANFILARFADMAEAVACDLHLQSQGILVRQVSSYGLPDCLRITIGDQAACRRVAHVIAQFKGLK